MECDTTNMYDEIIDTIYHRQTIPQFFKNFWNGMPQINIIMNEEAILSDYTQKNNNASEYGNQLEFEYDNGSNHNYNDDMTYNQNASDYEEAGGGLEREKEIIYVNELMNQSLEDKVAIISQALQTADVSQLKAVSVTRESIRPRLSAMLLNLSHQWDMVSSLDAPQQSQLPPQLQHSKQAQQQAAKLSHSIETEWHHQYCSKTKLIDGLSRMCRQRTITELFISNIVPELLWSVKNDVQCMYNDVSFLTSDILPFNKNSDSSSSNGDAGSSSSYPGLPSITRLLFNNWLGTTSVNENEDNKVDVDDIGIIMVSSFLSYFTLPKNLKVNMIIMTHQIIKLFSKPKKYNLWIRKTKNHIFFHFLLHIFFSLLSYGHKMKGKAKREAGIKMTLFVSAFFLFIIGKC